MSTLKTNKNNRRKCVHQCAVEPLEQRLMLSAAPVDDSAIQMGVLYIEGTFGSDQNTDDSYGDYVEVSYNGGASGTTMNKLEINLDKNGNGSLDVNEAFFHLAQDNPSYGAYNSVAFQVVSSDGTIKDGDVKWTISNNNQLLTLEFSDFESGDKLVCKFDVDFYKGISNQYDEDGNVISTGQSSNVTVNGDDFEGSTFKAYFSANNYEDVTMEKTFVDDYGSVKYGLDLDPNEFFPSDVSSAEEYVAGAFGTIIQTPVVNSISGFVYEDVDNTGTKTDQDVNIAGVTLTLYELSADGNYTNTGITTTTDPMGYYCFDNLFSGTYMVIETQPENYESVCANAGYVADTTSVSTVRDVNSIYKITLTGSQDSIQNNFGEYIPGQLSGKVWLDKDISGTYDSGDLLLENVKIELYDQNDTLLATTYTNADGYYVFTGLKMGDYTVKETWPTEYLHSGQQAGTTGGEVDQELFPGLISSITISSGGISLDNNFWEILPGKISGYVFEDSQTIQENADGTHPDQYSITTGVKTSTSKPIAGVTLGLYNIDGTVAITDAEGNALTTTTDENGYYEFDHLMPGSYCVIEVQPTDYLDGIDTAGTSGGWAFNPHDSQYEVTVKQFGTDRNNDAIIRIIVESGKESASNNFAEVNYVTNTPSIDPPSGPGEKVPFISYGINRGSGGGAGGIGSYSYSPAYMSRGISALYGGGGGTPVSAWHLGIINAGMARRLGDGVVDMNYWNSPIFDPVNWKGQTDPELVWEMVDWRDSTVTFTGEYGSISGVPLTGDFNGDGKDELALFVDGTWFIDINGNGHWDEDDLWVQLGGTGDQPVVGDWDGDGKADIGVYGKVWTGDWNAFDHDPGLPDADNLTRGQYKNMHRSVEFRTSGNSYSKLTSRGNMTEKAIDHVFYFGNEGDYAVTGDWNGDGVDNIGVFNNGNWYLDVDGNGRLSTTDKAYLFGQAGDFPVTGDWNGDGVTNLGVYRDGKFILDTNGNGIIDDGDAVVEAGQAGDRPISGDFNGDGIDEVGTVKLTKPSKAS